MSLALAVKQALTPDEELVKSTIKEIEDNLDSATQEFSDSLASLADLDEEHVSEITGIFTVATLNNTFNTLKTLEANSFIDSSFTSAVEESLFGDLDD